jgi:hypothetical protein
LPPAKASQLADGSEASLATADGSAPAGTLADVVGSLPEVSSTPTAEEETPADVPSADVPSADSAPTTSPAGDQSDSVDTSSAEENPAGS